MDNNTKKNERTQPRKRTMALLSVVAVIFGRVLEAFCLFDFFRYRLGSDERYDALYNLEPARPFKW